MRCNQIGECYLGGFRVARCCRTASKAKVNSCAWRIATRKEGKGDSDKKLRQQRAKNEELPCLAAGCAQNRVK